jgi:hypothetical protein
MSEQHPKQSISIAEWGPVNRASEHSQLLAECQVLKRDRPVSATDQGERSEHYDERGQHELSCRASDHRINRLGWRSDSGEAQYLAWLGVNDDLDPANLHL